MKRNVKRKSLFTAIITFIVTLLLSVSMYVFPAKMEGNVFVMEAGASVKLSTNGLRFTAKMDKAYRDLIVENDNVELWGYIAPVEEFDKVLENKDLIVKVGGKLDESKIYQGEGDDSDYYYANIVVTDLDKYTSGNTYLYAKSFSATIFIVDTRAGTPVYTYAEVALDSQGISDITAQNRTQYFVVNAAMLDGNASYEKSLIKTYGDWYGSEEYPIMVNSTAEYNGFVQKSQTTDFSGKSVFVAKTIKEDNNLADTLGGANIMDADHVVTFRDGNRIVEQVFVKDGENAVIEDPTRAGYKFVEWIGDTTGVTEDRTIYAKWKKDMGAKKELGDMTVYGAMLASGSEITSSSDVIGQTVILAGGSLGDGAYYPGETNGAPDPTDKNNTADQAYLAFDGSYGFNDYFVADFTGKNMPTLAFFANNYNNSIFYGDGTKNGVVVSTGLTWPDGRLFTEGSESGGPYCTSVWDGQGLAMWGPRMIYSTAKNASDTSQGVLLHSNVTNVALGRANLVDGTQYRIIMGMQPGDDASNKAIKLVYSLYDITNGVLVESQAINTYNFFADGWANGQTRDQFCVGSIVAYGYFGTATTLDKVYGIYEDTTVDNIAASFGMDTANNASQSGDSITLGAGSIGNGANYQIGQNNGGYVNQAYFAVNGEYNLNDYVAFDFTGKNMPEIAFFAKNYNESMYAEGTSKQGIVVVTGITTWDGSEIYQTNQDKATGATINYDFPYMIQNTANGGFCQGAHKDSALGRANLVDGTHYRVIMGFTGEGNTITLHWYLYNLDTNTVVEESSMTTWGFFSGSNAQVGNMTINDLSGAIVLYGKFGVETVIDHFYGVFEDTSITGIAAELGMNKKTVTFQNYDGTVLQRFELSEGLVPDYSEATPVREGGSTLYKGYVFAGWDKPLTAVTDDVIYTAVYNATEWNDGISTSTSKPVNPNGDGFTLTKSNLGDGANYTTGQNNGGYVDQSYFAFDGNYDFNDYIAFDFTGKNLPEVAFFAKNYNNSMYAEGTDKQGIVVVTGITTWDGQLGSGVNGNGTQINYGFPYFIQDAASGAFCQSALKSSAMGRANLVDGTHYRVIMGFTGSGSAITLNWYLYNLDTGTVVEQSSMTTWNFFTGSNAQVGNMTINDLSGSIVLYGKFGVDITVDKMWGVFENTDIATLANALNSNATYTVTFKAPDGTVLQEDEYRFGEVPFYAGETPTMSDSFMFGNYQFVGWDKEIVSVTENATYVAKFEGEEIQSFNKSNVTYDGEKIVLNNGNIGAGANYIIGQNAGGSITQAYFAMDGNYSFNDYIAFDFTGKNMPEIAFFAKNYNQSMYYEAGKQGVVVASGITLWNGTIGSAQSNNTQVAVSGPFGAYYQGAAAPTGGNMMDAFAAKLARANLIDGTQYRVIMGFTKSGASGFALNYTLYNLITGEVVETVTNVSWNFYTGNNAAVNNMVLDDLVGSIVLYGKFGTACTIDKLYGVFEDTTMAAVAEGLTSKETYTVQFKDEAGEVLQESEYAFGTIPSFDGVLPEKEDDLAFYNYVANWDKPISVVAGDTVYTLTFKGTPRNSSGVEVINGGEGLSFAKSSLGDGANYTKGQNNGGYVTQTYYAFDGNYGLDDYIAFDFTGKNMPEIAFFANNYNASMYAEGTSKQGIVVVTGITTWDGQLSSGVNGNGTQINYGFPYMIQDAASGSFCDGAFKTSVLGRANLADDTHYRVVMGFVGNGSAICLRWYVYSLDSNEILEEGAMTTWNFFTGSNEQVGNMTIYDLMGSIVLYGKFGATLTIDKMHGVFEDTSLESVLATLNGDIEEPSIKAPDYSKYTDQFDFYAYSSYSDGTYEIDGEEYYIGKTLANLKQYAMYGQAGLTIYFPQSDMLIDGNEASLAKVKKLLTDLAKVGIHKTILQDSRILYLSMQEEAIVGSDCQFANNDELDAYIYNCVKDYATLDGVYGIQLGDEPKYSMLSAYAAVYNSIKRVNEKYGFNLFIQYNLNPLNVSQNVYDNYYPATSGTYEWNNYRYKLGMRSRFDDCVKRYTQYINDFLNAMNPDSIMYDDYPLMEDKNGKLAISESYIPCLQIVAKAAADRGIAFYNVTQAFENNADGTVHRRQMTEKGANWLNNILLGFGAKQIAYYTYYTRGESDSTGGESYVDGSSFVNYNGEKTYLYDIMQTIMGNNQMFAPTVLQFEYQGSKVYGSTSADHLAEITVANSFVKLSSLSTSSSTLVTELYDDENDYYMYMAMNVLDPDSAAAQSVNMTFAGYTHALVYRNGEFTTVELNGGVYAVTLEAGEAAFVIPFIG